MGIFKGDKPNTKEFMKYEDGKIVSIEVEQAPKHKPVEHYPVEEEQKEKQPRLNAVKRYATKGVMKKVAIVVILVLFAFALYDVYKAFFTTQDTTTQPNTNQPVVTKPVQQPNTSNPVGESTSPTLPTTTNPVTPTVEDKGNTAQTPTADKNPFAYLLSLTNQVNASMIKISSDELAYISRYEDRQANKIGLQKHLASSQAQKEELYKTLATFEPLFIDENLKELYAATVNRLVTSIQFTKDVNASFSSSASVSTISDAYIGTDENLRLEQQSKLIDVLKQKNIPYTINEATKNVEYTIPQ